MPERQMSRATLMRTLLVLLIVGATMTSTLVVASGRSQKVRRFFDARGFRSASRDFVLIGSKWPTTNLTYGFVNRTPDLSASTVDAAVAGALAAWSSNSALRFTLVGDCGGAPIDPTCNTPDIRIFFAAGDHGDSDPFDGPNGVLAHAAEPGPGEGGDFHLDEAETWTFNLLKVVTMHEVGHALGIDHTQPSNCTGANPALMCPELTTQTGLQPDDIAAVQALYGTGSANVTVSVSGKGNVTSSTGGISCPSQCSATIADGTNVTFTATKAGRRSRFAGWGGVCAAAGRAKTCTVTVTGSTNVLSATFEKRRR